MRYLIISDIHGNLQALEAVVADAHLATFDATLCLGDLVGYGGDPNAVVDAIAALTPASIVRGNHDKVAAGLAASVDFHDQARAAVEWTARTLTPASRAYLRALPMGPVEVEAGLLICHGAPFDEDHYIFDARDAWRALHNAAPSLCLYGHTHVPAAFGSTPRSIDVLLPDADPRGGGTQLLGWSRTQPMLANIGAVGQPRDGDPRAAYGILDTTSNVLEFRRTEYDIKAAQARIRAAGLPERLAQRLDRGA